MKGSTTRCSHIFLNGGCNDLLWGLAKSRIDDFHPFVAKALRNHQRSAVVTVQPRFRNQYPNRLRHRRSSPLLPVRLENRRAIFPEDVAQYVADFANGGISPNSVNNQWHQILIRLCTFLQCNECPAPRLLSPFASQFRECFRLLPAERWIHPEQFRLRFVVQLEFIHANDDLVSAFDGHLRVVRSLVNLLLQVSLFNCSHGTAEFIDVVDVRPCAFLNRVGERLDVVAARQRIYRIGDSAFVRKNLLCPQSNYELNLP